MDERFPRELTETERGLLLWILPLDRPGYNEYRTYIETWKVVAQGRRGEGNYILAEEGAQPDRESPLPQIFALGNIISARGELSVSLRERLEGQVEFEIVSVRGYVEPALNDEKRRWTLSTWSPTQACPQCGLGVREVRIVSVLGRQLVVAVCANDQRLWVYDGQTGVNHPIPVTNFYNELMLHKNIRDPKIALDSGRLFSELSRFNDTDLAHAFQTYNTLRTKIPLGESIVIEEQEESFLQRLKHFIGFARRGKR